MEFINPKKQKPSRMELVINRKNRLTITAGLRDFLNIDTYTYFRFPLGGKKLIMVCRGVIEPELEMIPASKTQQYIGGVLKEWGVPDNRVKPMRFNIIEVDEYEGNVIYELKQI